MEQETTLQNLIKERLEYLPQPIQEAIIKSNWETKIIDISKKYNLLIDQAGAVQSETFLTMLGISNHRDYVQNLVKSANIDVDTAKNIANDVENQIFYNIKEMLIQITEDKIQNEEESNELEKNELQSAGINIENTEDKIININKNTPSIKPTEKTPGEDSNIITKKLSEPTSTKNDPYREPVI